MKVILIRHGAYSPSSIDPSEGLSAEGKQEVQTLKSQLSAKNIKPTKIFSSPKKRAQQTAAILADSKPIETTDLLKGGENPQKIIDAINGEVGTIMLVGHNPFMENLSTLLGKTHSFHTAGFAIFNEISL